VAKNLKEKQPDMSEKNIASQNGDVTGKRTVSIETSKRSPRSRRALLIFLTILVLVMVCRPKTAVAVTHRQQCPPKILVLRGLMEVFSLGMNDLAKKLECRGYDVELTSWSMALCHAECSDPRPIVIIGHSLGGRMSAWVSRKLKGCGVSVPLIIIVDANLIQSIPSNVERCVHLYVTNELGIFHGGPVRGESLATDVVNRDVSKGQPPWYQGGVNHFDIDATPWVHQIIIGEIEARFPSPCEFAQAKPTPGANPRVQPTLRGIARSQPSRTRNNVALVSHEEPLQRTSSQTRQASIRSTRRRTISATARGQTYTRLPGIDGKKLSIGSLGGP
jgi:hypothetical protein